MAPIASGILDNHKRGRVGARQIVKKRYFSTNLQETAVVLMAVIEVDNKVCYRR